MFKWLSNLFKRKEVEVKESEFDMHHAIGDQVFAIPDNKKMYAKIVINPKIRTKEYPDGVPEIRYFKKQKMKKAKYGLKEKQS